MLCKCQCNGDVVCMCALCGERAWRVSSWRKKATWFSRQSTLVSTMAHLRELITLSLNVRVSCRTALFSRRKKGLLPAAEKKMAARTATHRDTTNLCFNS